MKPRTKTIRGLLLATVVMAFLPPSGAAQQAAQPSSDDVAAPEEPVSPGGAFLRSLIVPGWGHASTESYTRGGFYFLTSGATLWMAFKTARSLSASEDRLALMEREVEAEILREFLDPPDDLQDQVESDSRVEAAQSLVDTRSQQMEDWTAFGIFWLLLGAADAFVSTHLADFPDPVEIDVAPARGLPSSGRPGGEIRFSVPLGAPLDFPGSRD